MKEFKGTQGKWYLQEYTDAYTNIIRCDNGVHETLFIASTPQNNSEEARRNAKLIAAAPDLLEALQELVKQVETFTKGNIGEQEYFRLEIVIAKKAINKALGE